MIRKLLAVAVALLAVPAASGAPPLREGCVLPSDRATVVRFRATDGTRLAGALLGRGPVGIVLAHQLGGDLCQWLPFARTLRAAGFRALAFDFRGYGSSAPVAPNVHLDRDVAGAVAGLRRRGVRKVFLIGASMGGTGVLGAAATVRPRVDAVVDLSGPARFGGVDALAAVRRLSSPALFVAARGDLGFVDATRALYGAARSREKRLVIRPGGAHGVGLLEEAEVRRLILAFVREHA